jgi:hypothetical protein
MLTKKIVVLALALSGVALAFIGNLSAAPAASPLVLIGSLRSFM